MLKDITLGQFFPGNSPIHRLDPRTKLLMVVVYIIALFTAKSWLGYLILFGFLALAVKLSTISPKVLVRGMKPIVMIVIFTAVLNLLFTPDGSVLVHFWVITITTGGVSRATRAKT